VRLAGSSIIFRWGAGLEWLESGILARFSPLTAALRPAGVDGCRESDAGPDGGNRLLAATGR